MAKEKKEKITYIDDGRTIADMSAFGARPKMSSLFGSGWKEKLRTLFETMGLMFLPTMAIMGLVCLLFLIIYLLL
jgi:hypothetical protein